jgi:feruloyl esterase
MPWVARGFACLLAASSSLLLAADCAGLKTLRLADTTITVAETITSGAPDIADAVPPLKDLPAFCRVAGELRPTSDSRIRFEVWLPAQGWNGRLLGGGNGGFAGSIYYAQLAGYLKRGFAVAATDAGHEAEGTDATWPMGTPKR